MEKLNELIKQRNLLELEAETITIQLKSFGPNGEPPAGLKDSLCDSEGYPRNDIDLYDIRRKRNRLAIINTDYKIIMKEIENELKLIYSNKNENNNEKINENENVDLIEQSSSSSSSGSSSTALSSSSSSLSINNSNNLIPKSILIPFAIIDEILPNSPAQLDGLVDGDKLLKFGPIEGTMENPLTLIPRVVLDNSNHVIYLLVNRNGEEINISLTPRSWSGRGLLGCHLTPIV